MASLPSLEERQFYYSGLRGRPLLVARSSVEPWTRRFEDFHQVGKAVHPVGKHAIVELWSEKLIPQLREKLANFAWQSLDLVRIGYHSSNTEPPTDFPVILWISVKPNSTDWNSGQQCIWKCMEILRAHSLLDVQCEIREGQLTPYVGPALLNPDDHHNLLPFTATLGQSIATVQNPNREGSLALFLKEAGSTNLFGLTCRHVPFEINERAAYEWNESRPKIEFIQPGTGTLTEEFRSAETAVETWNSKAADRFEEDVVKKNRDQAKKDLAFIKSVQEVPTRVIGHVVFSPAFELCESRWLQDFAIIQLNKEKFKDVTGNSVYIGPVAERDRITTPVDGNFQRFCTMQPRFLKLHSIFPMTKLLEKKWKQDSNGDYFQVVAKRGRTSRLSFGYLNNVVSVLRRGLDLYSEELCITSFQHTAFSQPGDSGAPIFDTQGNVYGMTNSGMDGQIPIADITYTTPIERIFDSIEKRQGRRFQLL